MQHIAGFHAIEEYLRSLRSAGAAKGARILVSGSGPRIKAILAEAAKSGIQTVAAGREELDRKHPEHRGILLELEAQAARPSSRAIDLDEFLTRPPEQALVLVLDHIEDPQNLGAILRSADAFAADLVILPTRRTAPLSEAAAKASAGALAHARLCFVPNLAEALRRLAEAGFWRYAADMRGEKLADAQLPARLALVLGNEGSGVARLLKTECDGLLSIPMAGHVDSLNVSASAAIFMYEYRGAFPVHSSTGNDKR